MATLASASFVFLSFFSFLKVLDTLCDVHLVKLSHICINVYYRQGEFVTGSVFSSGELNFGALC